MSPMKTRLSTSPESELRTANEVSSLPFRPSTTSSSSVKSPPSATSPTTSASSTSQAKPTFRTPAPTSTPLNLPTSSVSQSLPRHILSRRRRYLEIRPSYFNSASTDAELSNPLAYDRFIRRHQGAAEREAEGKKKGFAGTLEAGLLRGEARRADVTSDAKASANGESYREDTAIEPGGIDWSIAESPEKENDIETQINEGKGQEEGNSDDFTNDLAYLKEKMTESQSLQTVHRASKSASPSTFARSRAAKDLAKKLGKERWHELLAERFVSGRDENFDYKLVDEDEALDGDWAGRKAEEDWFEEEESTIEGIAQGETGVQDF